MVSIVLDNWVEDRDEKYADCMMKFSISHSQYLLIYLFVVHSVAIILLLMTMPMDLWLMIMLMLVIVSFCYYSWQYGWFFKKKMLLESLTVDEKAHWHLHFTMEQTGIHCELIRARILPGAIFLYFKTLSQGKSQSVIVMRDAICPDDWRRLRAYLKGVSFSDE